MWEFEDSKERQNPDEGMDVRSSRTRNLQPTGQVEEHLLYGVEHKGRERQDPEGEIRDEQRRERPETGMTRRLVGLVY